MLAACSGPLVKLNDTHFLDHGGSETLPKLEGETVTYTCEAGRYFDTDRNKTSLTVTCRSDSTFDWPNSWPRCLDAVTCPDPPQPQSDSMIEIANHKAGASYDYEQIIS